METSRLDKEANSISAIYFLIPKYDLERDEKTAEMKLFRETERITYSSDIFSKN